MHPDLLRNKYIKICLVTMCFPQFSKISTNLAASDTSLSSTYRSDNCFPIFSYTLLYLCEFSSLRLVRYLSNKICIFNRPSKHYYSRPPFDISAFAMLEPFELFPGEIIYAQTRKTCSQRCVVVSKRLASYVRIGN